MPKGNNISAKGLVRGLGLWSATAVVVGSMIGQSVFLVANDMARELGSVTKILSVWILGGVVVLVGSFCYAELGAAMPETGGDYVYLSRGLNPLWGFLYGWASTMILKPGSGAIIAAGLLRLSGFLLPSLLNPIFTWHIRIPFQVQPYQFTFTVAQLLAAAMIVIVTVINYFGVRTAGRFQILLTSLKVAAVAAIVLLGFTLASGIGAESAMMASPAHGDLQALLIAVVPVMLAYNGFGILGHVGGEVLNPGKNVPRAAILGSSLVIGLYVLINWVYFRVLGVSGVAQSQHVASGTISALIGGRGAEWITLAMIVSAFGSLHANLLAGPRVPYAMAREGVFFGFAKRIQPVFHTPSGAVIFEGCAAIILVLTGTYQDLYSFAMFAYWTFYALTALALIRLRRTEPELLRPYRAWGYPWTPIVFSISAFAISINLWLVRPVRSSIGLVVILLGLPFFYYWRKRKQSNERAAAVGV
jgi:APA family basic amino acid/polyamine antiporter